MEPARYAPSSSLKEADPVTQLVITVPGSPSDQEGRKLHESDGHHDEIQSNDDLSEQHGGSDVSSLENASSTADDPLNLYQQPQHPNDDLIEHHLNRFATMSAHFSRSAMISSYRRRVSYKPNTSPLPYHHGYNGNQWSPRSTMYRRNWAVEGGVDTSHDEPDASQENDASASIDAGQESCKSENIIDGSEAIEKEVHEEEKEEASKEQPMALGNESLGSYCDAGSDLTDADMEKDKDDGDSFSQESTDSPLPSFTIASEIPGEKDEGGSPYRHQGSGDSKYENYALLVDPNQGDRSVEIELHSFARPHMRAFHLAWMAFFVAFFTWFAITPLLSEVARSLDLTRWEIWTSSTFAVAGSAVTRILIGPMCDKYGARWAMSTTLVVCAIPTALLGLVNSAVGLNMLRLVIGVAGSAFVTSEYWTSSFFTREVAGTANALVAGWGNLGGGVTQIVMGTLLFPLFKIMYGGTWGGATQLEDDAAATDGDEETEEDHAADLAWRTVCIFPAVLCFITAFALIKWSDDSPKGNYNKRRREGLQPSVSAWRALGTGIANLNTWILLLQYGCCFGVEITMVNAAALYFKEEFGQSTESAAAIASIFGWMNLFARGVGGFASDMSNARAGMRGRLIVQSLALLVEGILVIVFSETQSLGAAIAVMVFFSVFVQAAEGSTFAVVPYVNPIVNGAISGIVGAGGNVGGVGFSLLFRENAYRQAFKTMGYVVMGSATLTPIIRVEGHRSLLFGEDAPAVQERRLNHSQQMGDIPSVHQPDESRRSTSSQLRTPGPDDATKETCTAV